MSYRSTQPRRFLKYAALAAVITLPLAACAPAAEPEEETPAQTFASLDELCTAAIEEETAEAWLNFGNIDPIIAAFGETYPEVDIAVLTILSEDGAPRLIAEDAAGQTPTADLVYGNLPAISPLIQRDLIASDIDWASIGVDGELVNEFGTVRIAQVAYGLGYNTDKYSADDLPDTWEELLDPAWSGKLIIDPRGRPFSFLSQEWGQEKTVEVVQEIMDTLEPIVIQGTSAGLAALVSGEGDVLLNSKTAETAEFQADGAPVEIKLLDVIPVEGTQLGVLAKAEQPLAAQCFIGWAASEAGSAAIFEAEFKSNVLPEVPEGAIYVEIQNEDDLAAVDATIEELTQIIAG